MSYFQFLGSASVSQLSVLCLVVFIGNIQPLVGSRASQVLCLAFGGDFETTAKIFIKKFTAPIHPAPSNHPFSVLQNVNKGLHYSLNDNPDKNQ